MKPKKSQNYINKFILGLTTFLLIPIASAAISYQIILPSADRADRNWGGLLVSPGDIIVLKAIAIGFMMGLIIGSSVYLYSCKKYENKFK